MNMPLNMAMSTTFMVMTGMITILFIHGTIPLVMIAGHFTAYMDAGMIDLIMGFRLL
jgi:hypothetical protein